VVSPSLGSAAALDVFPEVVVAIPYRTFPIKPPANPMMILYTHALE
jgi:hypothetical protein